MKTRSSLQSNNVLETRLHGSRSSAFLSELLSNSGHFFLLKSLSHLISHGWFAFITDPTEYLLAAAMLLQTWYLSRPQSHRFWGNLIGVSLYTIIDFPIDKWDFFIDYNHIVFWLFSLIIATLQGLRCHWFSRLNWLISLESLARATMVVAFYVVMGLNVNKLTINNSYMILQLLSTKTHKFLLGSMILIGLLLGLQTFQITKQKKQLQETAKLLGDMAEWGMGSHFVATALSQPEKINFHKCERTILFMDIRGFTAWCENIAPDIVAELLNNYYRQVQPAAAKYYPLKVTLTADEIMAIYATPQQGVAAAIAMRQAALETLAMYGLGAGCAVHCGSVIEGLFGGEDVRTYTVIGDVVNTGKRLEGATPAGVITISDAVYQTVYQQLEVEPCEPIKAKGKTEPLKAWRLVISC